jgi:hypothetical protein
MPRAISRLPQRVTLMIRRRGVHGAFMQSSPSFRDTELSERRFWIRGQDTGWEIKPMGRPMIQWGCWDCGAVWTGAWDRPPLKCPNCGTKDHGAFCSDPESSEFADLRGPERAHCYSQEPGSE